MTVTRDQIGMRMRGKIIAAVGFALLVAGCSPEAKEEQQTAAESAGPVPQAQLPRVALPEHYAVTLTIDPAKSGFSGHAEIAMNFTEARKTLFIHGLEIRMKAVYARLAGGKRVAVTYKQVSPSGVALLTFADAVPKGRATLVFDYDAPYNESLAGLYKVVDRGDNYAFTQFENTDARRVFPSFDEPGFKAPFDITVIAPSADKVVGNTPVASATPVAGGMTKTVFEATKPLPTYLIALAIGPLDIVDAGVVPPSALRPYAVPVRGVTARGNGPRLKYAMTLTASIVTALENYYGIAYPFQKLDVLAVPDFEAGAMENAGAITYRERLLLDADQSLEQRRASLTVQAHELAHQWFGDYVTPVWWDDIWLNESFANWMEAKTSKVVRPDEEYGRKNLESALDIMHADEAASARQIHQPVHNNDDINNAFDGITYDKGAAVLAMFESYVGEAGWRAGIHAYLTKFAFRNATAQDFIGTIAAVTHKPEIVAAFNSFIDQPGVPYLNVAIGCAANAKTADVTQSIYVPMGRVARARTWQVPMCMKDVGGKTTCSMAGAAVTHVALGGVCSAATMPNAEGTGYYRFTLSETEWQKLFAAAAKLSAADQRTIIENVDAGFRAGKVSATAYFAAIRAIAPTASWDTLVSLQDSLKYLRTTIMTPDELASYRAMVAELFGPRLAKVGYGQKPGEKPAVTLEREYLAQIMVGEARDAAVLRALAGPAKRYVASGGKDFAGLAPDIAGDAMRAGLLVEGMPFADAMLLAMRNSNSENFRRTAIYAFAGVDDPAILKKVVALTGTLRIGEIRYLYQFMGDEPVARMALWAHMKKNFEAIRKRVSPQGFGRATELLAGACDLPTKNDLHAFFAPKTKDLEGTERTLAQTEEKIGYCIALKTAKGAEFDAALRSAAAHS
ncbi:MAG TPA: M1 family metallopeptidase [Rhizomicrobium sp.]|jgi:alanyl aminopeptidase|nr:M1 family metallopeptidase [Rhizomicrobium sp.]